jgi:hypothetical protein
MHDADGNIAVARSAIMKSPDIVHVLLQMSRASADAQMGEADAGPTHSAAEAGPEAMAEAERLRNAYEREHDMEGLNRSVESVMEDIIEQAYAEDGMEVSLLFDSPSRIMYLHSFAAVRLH